MRILCVSLAMVAGLISCNKKSSFKGSANQGAIPVLPVPVPPPPQPDIPPPETETTDLFKDCQKSQSSQFFAKLYKLPVGTERLPHFPGLTPMRDVCLKQIDIATRNFAEGFPGVDELIEWFALDIYFDVNIEKAGDYKFRVNSDDGSRLIIDGTLAIDNDGTHGPASKDATVTLAAGKHKFNLQYFQGPREQIALELFWKVPGSTVESYLPLEMVSRPQ